MLNDIEAMYTSTIEENQELLEENMQNFPIHSSKLMPVFKKQLWLLGSYIVFTCNLEQTIKQEYKHIKKHIKEIVVNVSFNDQAPMDRAREIDKYKFYRNKIFAHTAFGDPIKDDDPYRLETSLQFFAGNSFSITDKGMGLGGTLHGPAGCCYKESKPTPSNPKPFEHLDFLSMTNDMANHFAQWLEMYKNAMDILRNTPDVYIKQRKPEIVDIVRKDK